MAFELSRDPKATRGSNYRGSRSYNHADKHADLLLDDARLKEKSGSKAVDSDGELHVDLSTQLDDLEMGRIGIYGSAREAQWLPHEDDVTLKFSGLTGNYVKGETVTGDGGATATVESIEGEAAGFLQVSGITGSFVAGETLTGGGGATSTLETEEVDGVDTVEIEKQRILIAQVRELSTGAATGGTPTVTYTGEAEGPKA
jgi:hypothetical protein